MNAEFAIPNCVRVPGRERGNRITIWKPTRTKTKSCVKRRFLPAGLQNVSPLHLPRNTGTENDTAISSWAEHWSIGQSYPYCKERPFSERNPQLLSTVTIATILNFILLRGLWSSSELEEQFSDAKVSYHLKTTIFFASKFLSLEWSLFFWMGGWNWSTTHGLQIFSEQAFVYPTCWQTQPWGPFKGAPKEVGIEGPLLINANEIGGICDGTGVQEKSGVLLLRGCWGKVVAGCSLYDSGSHVRWWEKGPLVGWIFGSGGKPLIDEATRIR